MNNKGFSLVEMMIALSLLGVVMVMMYGSLSGGEAAWHASDGNIKVAEQLRQGTARISKELRKSSDTQFILLDNTGTNSTDIIRFAIPVIYNIGDPYVSEDVYGDTVVSNWGAPLTWGCSTTTCNSADYTHVQYLINSSNRLIRQVIRVSDLTVYQEDIMARNIADMQVTDNGTSVDVTLRAQVTTSQNKIVSESRTFTVYLRNEG